MVWVTDCREDPGKYFDGSREGKATSREFVLWRAGLFVILVAKVKV